MNKLTIVCVIASGLALTLVGCVSPQKYNESQQHKNAELEQEYQQLIQQINQTEVDARNMQITRMQHAIRVSINSELLFPSGSYDMSESAEHTIAKFASILAPHQQTKIIVDGYTDTTPIGPGLMKSGITSNLILSQKRADTVMQYMISQGVRPNLIAARGFGESSPVASNHTPKGRAKNRRVELNLASANE
jgi:chemotaxis protein MotB